MPPHTTRSDKMDKTPSSSFIRSNAILVNSHQIKLSDKVVGRCTLSNSGPPPFKHVMLHLKKTRASKWTDQYPLDKQNPRGGQAIRTNRENDKRTHLHSTWYSYIYISVLFKWLSELGSSIIFWAAPVRVFVFDNLTEWRQGNLMSFGLIFLLCSFWIHLVDKR